MSLNIQYIVLAYNRPTHLKRTLDALMAEGVDSLTIYIDGPKSAAESHLVDEVGTCATTYAPGAHIVRSIQNRGLANSVVSAVTASLKNADAMVLLEDDCRPLPGFKAFMEAALTKYRHNKKIRSISGYQLESIASTAPQIGTLFSRRFLTWGWATWADRWQDYSLDLARLRTVFPPDAWQSLPTDLRRYCEDREFIDQKMDIWSLNWSVMHYLTNTFVVYPSRSLVENTGFDGTGVHCANTQVFTNSSATSHKLSKPVLMCDNVFDHTKYLHEIEAFMERHSALIMYRNKGKSARR